MALYIPPAFRAETDELTAFIEARGFASLVTLGAEGLDVTPLPLIYDAGEGPQGRLIGHLARANPQWRRFDPAVSALALFHGVDAYVSPAWYPSKQEHGRVVPTWNYELVTVTGRLSIFEDPERLLALVTRLTERHEGQRSERGGQAWAVADAPAAFTAAQLKGIVGLELSIERIEGKRKLSQNRPEGDRAGIMAEAPEEGLPGAAEMVAAMRR